MNVLVAGGAGFIGSHTIIELIKAGHFVVVIDSLINSSSESIKRVEYITGVEIPFYKVDVCNRIDLEKVFRYYSFDACIHFAGLKSVSESVAKPWKYYYNNIQGTLILLDVLRTHGCKNLIYIPR